MNAKKIRIPLFYAALTVLAGAFLLEYAASSEFTSDQRHVIEKIEKTLIYKYLVKYIQKLTRRYDKRGYRKMFYIPRNVEYSAMISSL